MNKISKIDVAIWVVAALPLLLVAVVYTGLPEQIIMQWSFDGQVRYEPKWHLWMVAALAPALAALMCIMPKIDPKKRNYTKFLPQYRFFQLMMMVFILIMTTVVIAEALRPNTVNVGVAVTIFVGVLLLLIGNMMPKFRHNYFCGIRTPWTLASESVWNRTNRLGGRSMFAAGLLIILSVLLPEASRFVAFMILIATASLLPCMMSYVWYQREQKDEKPELHE